MWEKSKAACGCHIKVGKVADVGTPTRWAVTPRCSFTEPLMGEFDEFGRAIMRMGGGSEATFQPCQINAEYRIVLDGGPMVNPSDDLVCALHLEPRKAQLEQQARELSDIFCDSCFKIKSHPQLKEFNLPSEDVCSCETI